MLVVVVVFLFSFSAQAQGQSQGRGSRRGAVERDRPSSFLSGAGVRGPVLEPRSPTRDRRPSSPAAGVMASSSAEKQHYCQSPPVFANNARPGMKLLQVQILTRHGDRAPQNAVTELENVQWQCPSGLIPSALRSKYPSLYTASSSDGAPLPGTCINGQLTEKGVQQLRQLGRAAREVYVDRANVFPANVSPAQAASSGVVGARSTLVGRTVQSAYHFLEGLFAGKTPSAIPIVTRESNRDNAFPNSDLCPALKARWDSVRSGPAYQSFYMAEMQPLANRYASIWNINVTDRVFRHINDMVRARYCHRMLLPPSLTDRDAESIILASRKLKNIMAESPATVSMSSGGFLQDLANLSRDPKVRLQIFAIHDDTIRSLLMALHAFDGRWPPYASHLALEFWENERDGTKSVVLQFDGQNKMMGAPCKNMFCLYEDFLALVKRYSSNSC